MNKKELNTFRRKVWYKYKIPGMSNLHRVKKNALFLHVPKGKDIGYEHEKKKFDVCFALKKAKMEFITEAQSCKDGRIIDVVCLDTGTEIEVVDSSLTDITKEAIEKGDIPIMVLYLDDAFDVDDMIRRVFA